MGDGEDAAGEGAQNDCRWGVELGRDCDEEEEEGVRLPLLLVLDRIPAGLEKPFGCGGSRGEAVGGGRCLGGEGGGWGSILPITEAGLWTDVAMVTCL